ncbi:MAG: molybdopterin-dependent oxidoreductase [Actinomycetia bacterium]|nr:molybdopterin-dependent oxidoreductase [Actinomycetes bacterium]MCP4959947.1 molybdopterin-dependent oxidoreductase [Actinomycetes bacterium]
MEEINGACPLDCPDGCAWVVTVDDQGEAVKLRGSTTHPFTRGGLCKKINPWLEHAADPSRLLHPLRRIGAKGGARFETIGWDEAIETIAGRLTEIVDSSGGSAIWPFYGTGTMGYVQGANSSQRLWNRMGASAHHLSICSPAGHAGLHYTTGTSAAMDPEDVVEAGTVLIWGSNTLVSNQHWWPYVNEARRRGARIAVVDPLPTRTAQRSDLHLAPRPGTDGALALAICHSLITTDAVDSQFLTDNTIGFDEFAGSVAAWPIERAAVECDVDAAQIEQLVEWITAAPPLAMKLGQGMQRHATGGQAARAISCIPALVGAYAQHGGGLVYSTSREYRFNPKGHHTELGARPRTLNMTMLADELRRDRDQPVEAVIIVGANPVVSNPDTNRVRAALSSSDIFTVVIDTFPTETVEYADIVLPSTLQHEQLELNNSFSHFYTSLNLPAVEPPGQCLPHTEIRRRLAAAMGYTDTPLFESDEQIVRELLDQPDFLTAGITFESLSQSGWARLPYADPWRPVENGFATPSGRFEFVSGRAENDGNNRLPHYVRAHDQAAVREPSTYELVAPAGDWHLNSVFAGTDVTTSRTVAPAVSVNPDDARRDHIKPGDRVLVSSSSGSFEAVLAVDTAMRRGVAASSKGWWRQGVNNVVAERNTDLGHGPVYHGAPVTITLAT